MADSRRRWSVEHEGGITVGFVDGQSIAWTRWWAPSRVELRTYGGLLPEPRDELGRYANPEIGSLADFADRHALVLLGEPGAGKSTELAGELARREGAGEQVVRIDLGRYITPDRVERAIQDGISARSADAHGFTLAFDGFDEPLLTISNLADVLEEEIDRLDRTGLKILIASRGALWQDQLTLALRRWWPDGVEVLTLAPLTETDIRTAAATEPLDVDDFIRETETAGGQALAGWPITLRLLLSAAREGKLPKSRTDVYRRGVDGLAEERGRRKNRRQDGTPLDRRIAAAQRIAAVTLLSGRNTVARRAEVDTPEGAVPIDRLMSDGISLAELDAAFDTALFMGEGSSRRWVHRTVEEYLCARELSKLPPDAAIRLVGAPDQPGELLPQLADTASWIAALSTGVFDWLVDHKPTALLTPDLHGRPAADRERVAKAIITRLKDGEPPTVQKAYGGLAHPKLAADLEPLLDPGEPWWRRREAMYIIAATGTRDLDGRLVPIVKDAARTHEPHEYDQDVQLAESAAFALDGATAPSNVDRLKTVLADTSCPRSLRQALAATLWPSQLTVDELLCGLEDLTDSNVRRRLTGLFSRALRAGKVEPHDLIPWLASFPYMDYYDRSVQRLAVPVLLEVMGESVRGSEDWTTATAAIVARPELLQTITTADVAALPEDRRRLFAYDVLQGATRGAELFELAARLEFRGFFQPADPDWWIAKLADADDDGDLEFHPAAAALARLAWESDIELPRDDLPRAVAQILEEIFGEAARAERERMRQQREVDDAEVRRSDHAHRFSPERFACTLDSGNFEELEEELNLDLDRSGSSSPVRAWDALDPTQRKLVAEVVKDFLSGEEAVHSRGSLLVTAYDILEATAGDMIDEVPAATWLDLLPKLLRTPQGDTAALAALIRAATHDPAATTDILIDKLRDDAAFGLITLLDTQRVLALDALSAEALALAAGSPKDTTRTSLLVLAGRTLPRDAADLAIRFVQDGGPRAVSAAVALTSPKLSPDGFETVLTAFRQDTSFAIEVIQAAGQNAEWRTWRDLAGEQAAQLYLWAITTLPPQKPTAPGVVVNGLDPVGDFAQDMIRQVIAASTEEAARLLDDLASQTDNIWLYAEAQRLRESLRASNWTPPTADEVLDLIKDPRKRFITTPAQLCGLVLDLLDEIADDLRKDRALKTNLWNQQRENCKLAGYAPVDENQLSTWLARELKARLAGRVAMLREVEIQPHLGDASADRPDLLAVVTTAHGELTVPIEVKGNWHDEVDTAIETQLADRYLQGPYGSEGIYLVGYFASGSWTDHDRRRRRMAGRIPRPDLEQTLRTKAAEIGERGIAVHVRVLDLSLT